MLSSSRLFLFATLVALALGGCDCSSDPSNRDGGGGGDDDGGGDGGDTDPTDGGDDDGGGGGDAGDAGGGGGTTCLTIAQACSGKCGFVSDNCESGFDCSGSAGVAAGGIACANNQICSNSACTTPPLPDGGTPPACPDPRTNTGTRCMGVRQTSGQPTGTQTCGEWIDAAGCPVDCWSTVAHTCPTDQVCAQNGNSGPFACRATNTGPVCDGTLCPTRSTACGGTPTNTRLHGFVRTPGRDHDNNGATANINKLGVPNAIVYIPATPNAIPAIADGVTPNDPASCGRCADEKFTTGTVSVLASAVTNYAGEFTLEGQLPLGVTFNLVIKSGKWRRVVQIAANRVSDCNTVELTEAETTLNARNTPVGAEQAGTHLPLFAVSTGQVDAMECVLRGLGIDQSEFTLPSANGRVRMYRANGAMMPGAVCTGTTNWSNQNRPCSDSRSRTFDHDDNDNTADMTITVPNWGCWNDGGAPRNGCAWVNPASNIYASESAINAHDMVVFDCEASEIQRNSQEPFVESYVNNGGRMFASHFAYTWIENNGSLDASADWGSGGSPASGTGYVSLPTGNTARTRANSVKSLVFRDFLNFNGAITMSATTPQFTIANPRDRAGANAGASTDEWVYRTTEGPANGASPRIQQLSFNTPYGSNATNQCGRVAYSGFHVANAPRTDWMVFPNQCSNVELTPQEKVLAYMLFDLNSCVSTGTVDPPSTCTPRTKTQLCGAVPGTTCGQFSDGCGGIVNCDPCDSGEYCAGNTCTMGTCDVQTCGDLGFECGQHSDQCGGIATGCAPCPSGEFCSNGQCINNCVPAPDPCGMASANCGTVNDSCGNPFECGTCTIGLCTNNQCPLE